MNDVTQHTAQRPSVCTKDDPLHNNRNVLRGVNHGKRENSSGISRTCELSSLCVEGGQLKPKLRNQWNPRRYSTSPESVVEASPLRLPNIMQQKHISHVTSGSRVKDTSRDPVKGSPWQQTDAAIGSGETQDHSNDISRGSHQDANPLPFTKARKDGRSNSTKSPFNQKPMDDDTQEYLSGYSLDHTETSATDSEVATDSRKAKHTDMMLKFRYPSKDGGAVKGSSRIWGLKKNRAPPLDLKLLEFPNCSTDSVKEEAEKGGPPLDPERLPSHAPPGQQPRNRQVPSIPPKTARMNDRAKETDAGATERASGSSSTSDSLVIAPPYLMLPLQSGGQGTSKTKSANSRLESEDHPCCDSSGFIKYRKSGSTSPYGRMDSFSMSEHLQYSYTMLTAEVASEAESAQVVDLKLTQGTVPLQPSRFHDTLSEWQNNVQVLSFQPIEMRGGDPSGKYLEHQWYPRPKLGHVKPEVAGESIEMNEQLHNDIIHLIQKHRDLVLEYPSKLPCELDEMVRHRRPRTPRSFYGPSKPKVGKNWFHDAMKSVPRVPSPDLNRLDREDAAAKNNGRGAVVV
ncbi:unnamed protein product [Phytomonas sp. EM1]|nr:unnamed protein product [Phytomonas sp. EM1]|eukprot:CCW64456.1 unnamed protein product [Phytomonas sp. isolate EM1]